MKKIIIIFIILFASVVIAEVTTQRSPVNILIKRVMENYEKSVKDAEIYYKKYTSPIQKRKDDKIIAAGNIAINKLNFARRSVSEIESIKLEQQIEVVRQSLFERVGDISITKRKVNVLDACGIKYQGHTYIAFVSNVKFKEAIVLCKKMGGHLVYIETVEELVMMKRLFGTSRLWVGASKVNGKWKWGNGKIVDSKLWTNDYPKNYTCAIMHGDLKDTIPEGTSFGFICEWE